MRRFQNVWFGSRRNRLVIFALFLIALFCIGLAATFSYGMPWDEQVEMGIMFSNIKEYAARAGLEESIPVFARWHQVPKISEYLEKDHGAAAYYAFFPVYLRTGFETVQTMHAWHIYTFLLFFAGVAALFGLLRELFNRPVIWFGGTLSYFLMPRFFAEGHYNNKDLVFASLLLLMLLFLIRVIRKMTWKNLIPYAVFSGFLMNCRILGAVFWLFGGLFAVIYQIWRKRPRRVYGKIAAGFFLSLLIYYLLTPAGWDDPLQFVNYCLTEANSFSRWGRVILFSGNMISPGENGLPYTYLPKWMLMTIPEHVLVLFALSNLLFVIRVLQRMHRRFRGVAVPEISDQSFFMGMVLLLFWLPFAFLVLDSPNIVLYNGWRHCYFLCVPMSLGAMYALDMKIHVKRKERVGRAFHLVICGVLVAGLISTVVDIIRFHPYEYVYFNRIGRTIYNMEDYEGDYWNVSTLPSLRQFEETAKQQDVLKVALMIDAGGGQPESLTNSDRVRITEEADADYYLFNVSMLIDRSFLNDYELVSGIEREGYLISGVYRKKE